MPGLSWVAAWQGRAVTLTPTLSLKGEGDMLVSTHLLYVAHGEVASRTRLGTWASASSSLEASRPPAWATSGLPPPPPPTTLAAASGDVGGIQAPCVNEVPGDHGDQHRPVVDDRAEHDYAAAELVAQVVADLTQRVCAGSGGADGQHGHAVYVLGLGQQALGCLEGEATLHRLPLALEAVELGHERPDALLDLGGRGLKGLRDALFALEAIPDHALGGAGR